LDLVISPDVLSKEHRLAAVDRFLFRDAELGNICRKLCHEMNLRSMADRLYVETLAIEIASLLLREYSTTCTAAKGFPRGGLTHRDAG
jgi:hypothetical protein